MVLVFLRAPMLIVFYFETGGLVDSTLHLIVMFWEAVKDVSFTPLFLVTD